MGRRQATDSKSSTWPVVTGGVPRLDGLSETHVQLIAATAIELPPILVHRGTMRVIDGMHRLRAAEVRQLSAIDVRFFDGSEEEAFVVGVRANVYHGKPLTLNERKSAAAQILQMYPNWSDRRIADSAGLSHRTVAALRPCSGGQDAQMNARLGRDGRLHPLANAEGRLAAADLIAANPNASLRTIAREAGVSPGTVRDVRARLQRGASPIPMGARGRGAPAEVEVARDESPSPSEPQRRRRSTQAPIPTSSSPVEALHRLRSDPALRFNENGKALIRSLAASLSSLEGCEELALGAPDHCVANIAQVALATGEGWLAVAKALRERLVLGADTG